MNPIEALTTLGPVKTPFLDWLRKEHARRRAAGLCVVCGSPVSAPRFEKCDGCRRVTVEMYAEVLTDPEALRRIPWAGEALAAAIIGEKEVTP